MTTRLKTDGSSDLCNKYKEELTNVLQEFEPWQQTSSRQFVENKE
ncbi:hypothetical protein [Xylanibacter brevis]|nr:hypothetical protein [Xylanibacter brevis]